MAPTLHRFPSFDGESIPYLVYRPEPDEPAPVLLEIHGGPEAQRRPMWIPFVQYLVGHGFAVVQPNVRGSTGYGKRFEHLDDGRRRLDTVRDVAALHDLLSADTRFAADQTVLYGGSYGGYMVLACLAFEPERWAGGVAVVPISSLVTFLRNTSEYRRAFREREYGSPEDDLEFLVEASPITHVDRIRAPLLLIHGANDPRVPLGEAEQIHAALGERGIRSSSSSTTTRGTASRSSRIGSMPIPEPWLSWKRSSEGRSAGARHAREDEPEPRGIELAVMPERFDGDRRRRRDAAELRARRTTEQEGPGTDGFASSRPDPHYADYAQERWSSEMLDARACRCRTSGRPSSTIARPRARASSRLLCSQCAPRRVGLARRLRRMGRGAATSAELEPYLHR